MSTRDQRREFARQLSDCTKTARRASEQLIRLSNKLLGLSNQCRNHLLMELPPVIHKALQEQIAEMQKQVSPLIQECPDWHLTQLDRFLKAGGPLAKKKAR